MKIKSAKKKVQPVVDEVASVDDYDTSEKFIIRAECYPLPGMTQRDVVERLQKFFDFYHANLGIKILKD